MPSALVTSSDVPSQEERKEDRRRIDMTLSEQWFLLDAPVALTFAPGDVQSFNRQFIDILEDLRLDVQQYGVDLTGHNHNYLARLRTTGRAAYTKFLPKEVREYIVNTENKERERGLSLTFRSAPTLSLLWEMVYAGQPGGEVDPKQFWGFRYPLGRTYLLPRVDFPDRIDFREGIFSAVHEELNYSKQEIAQLAGRVLAICRSQSLNLRLQALDQNIDSVEALIETLVSQEFCYGIVHFACHCTNPENAGAAQAYLEFKVQAHELRMTLETMQAWQDSGFVYQPLVFLNACESATPGHLAETLSFPIGFLNMKAGGVIATACTIPDNFASAFATEFYRRLLPLPDVDDSQPASADGSPDRLPNRSADTLLVNIGEALLGTRRYFLEQHNNPLGLAYGLYAVSDQKLRLDSLV